MHLLYMRRFLISFLIAKLSLGQLNAQKQDSKIIEITNSVRSIDKDTSLSIIKFEKLNGLISGDSSINILLKSILSIECYYKDGKIKIIKTASDYSSPLSPASGHLTSYYFKEKDLIYVFESYSNSSRMGSCGTIKIKNHLYFANGILLKKAAEESPFNCYNLSIHPEIYLGILNAIQRFIEDGKK